MWVSPDLGHELASPRVPADPPSTLLHPVPSRGADLCYCPDQPMAPGFLLGPANGATPRSPEGGAAPAPGLQVALSPPQERLPLLPPGLRDRDPRQWLCGAVPPPFPPHSAPVTL